MFNSEAYRAATTVVLFWWTGLTLYSIYKNGQSWVDAFYSWKYVLFGVVFSAITSVGLAILLLKNKTYLIDESPAPRSKGFNMKTTMGSVPAWLGLPKMASSEAVPKLPKPILLSIIAAGKKDLRYKTLAEDMLRILALHLKAPASPYETGHGGETLFAHTVNVTMKMLSAARDYEYTGLYSNAGRLIVGLRDSSYKFDKEDPLILLCALAHDIGKLDSYIVKDGKVVGMKRNHDTLSLLMLARIPALMALDYKDQRALLGAVGYYHSPQTLPLDSASRARDDKTIALMELLRRCDRDASEDEDGFESPAETAKIQITNAQNKLITDEDIWNAFSTLVQEPGRVNGTSKTVTVGQKWESDVYFNEERTHREMLRILGIPAPAKRGDKTNPITLRLLVILLNKDLLMNVFNGKEYGPNRSSLFDIKFFDQTKGEEVAHWKVCFIVRPDEQMKHLAQMKTHAALAVIQGPVFGEQAARNKKAAQTGATPKDIAPETMSVGEGSVPGVDQEKTVQTSGSPFPSSPQKAAEVASASLFPTSTPLNSPFPSAAPLESPFPTSTRSNSPFPSTSNPFPSAELTQPEVAATVEPPSAEKALDGVDGNTAVSSDDGPPAPLEQETLENEKAVESLPIEVYIPRVEAALLPSSEIQNNEGHAEHGDITSSTPIEPDEHDAEDRMYSMCNTEQEEKDAQALRDQMVVQNKKEQQKEREKKLPPAIKARLKKLDNMVEAGAVEQFLQRGDKHADPACDASAASIYVCNLWSERAGEIGASFQTGKNPNNLYVMRVWLVKNASQFKWDDMVSSGAISTNSQDGNIFLKFDLTKY